MSGPIPETFLIGKYTQNPITENKKFIQKAKRLSFRKEIEKATESTGLWRLAKWAKDKSDQTREIPKMPNLVRDDQVAETFEEKSDMLKQKIFYPPLRPTSVT